jgi:phytoene synthase
MNDDLRLMTRAGKTFYFATFWLTAEAREHAATAYSFCRKIDDIADGGLPQEQRDEYLRSVTRALSSMDRAFPGMERVLSLIERFPEIKEPLIALVDACREDTTDLIINTQDDLLSYSHGVAGNVGLIMYPILGGRAPEGLRYAADLGIAMQCTNIARDVFEDLRRGRIYLPAEWLEGIDPQDLLMGDAQVEQVVVGAIRRLLNVAELHYERGLAGIHFLAPRCRYAIRVAARCYSAIGEGVLRGGAVARERSVVPLYKKILLACEVSVKNVRASRVTLSAK